MPRHKRAKRGIAASMAMAVATLGMAAGFTAATAPKVEAHTTDMSVAAVCDTATGNYNVTYTLKLDNVPRGQTGSTKIHFGAAQFVNGWNERSFSWNGGTKDVAGNGTVTFTQTLPGTTKTGPWVYAFTKWSPDGYTVKSDTRAEGLKGDCAKTPPPFDHNWEYAPPTCDGLTVTYPENIPAGQSNDVNVRVKNLATGELLTLNFHNNTGTWSGTKTFNVKDHPNWPGWTWFEYQWTQVAGTNYHWQGSVVCGEKPPPVKPEPIIEKLTDQRMSCEVGVEDGAATKTTDWILNSEGTAYVKGEPVISDWTWSKTRDLTVEEKLSLDCDKPEQPTPTVKPLTDERATCEVGVETRDGTETSATVFDTNTWTWVEAEPVIEWSDWTFSRDLTVAEKYELDCVKPIKPEPLKGSDVVETPKCLPEGGGVINITTTEWTQQPKWNDQTWSWEGYEDKVYDGPTLTTRPATAEECPNTLILVEPLPPVARDLCGTEYDFVDVPRALKGEYTHAGDEIINGKAEVVFTPAEGYYFPDDFPTHWPFSFTDDPCPTEPPTEEPPITTPPPTDPPTTPVPTPDPTKDPEPTKTPTSTVTHTATKTVAVAPVTKTTPSSKPQASLAHTGADNTALGLGIAGALLVSGAGALMVRRRMASDR